MVVKGAGMVLAGSATAAVIAATGVAGKSQLAVQSIGAMAAGAPGATSAASQGVGMISGGDNVVGVSDLIGESSDQLSSITDLPQTEFDIGNIDDIISENTELEDHNKPAIKGLGPN